MSRTYRKNKFGEVLRDNIKKEVDGCGCSYCSYLSEDFRRKHKKCQLDVEVRKYTLGLDEDPDTFENEKHQLDEESDNILKDENNSNNNGDN
jgi:hypothetical protein